MKFGIVLVLLLMRTSEHMHVTGVPISAGVALV